MAFRQVARKPAVFEIDWGDRFSVLPWTEDKTEEIARFILGTGAELFVGVPDCPDASAQSARQFVTRAREYMKGRPGAELGYAASSLVYDTTTGKLVAICLCCGASVYTIEVHPDYQRQGLATKMLKRALSVCAEHGVAQLDLWRHDGSAGARVYERLGFEPTGEIE